MNQRITHPGAHPSRRGVDYPPVYIQRAKCPGCASPKLYTYRSDKGGDGSVIRRTQCLVCGAKFTVVRE